MTSHRGPMSSLVPRPMTLLGIFFNKYLSAVMPAATLAAAILLSIFSHSLSAQTISVIDDNGRNVQLTHPARRIISLAPSLTELLFDAGAGEYVIGVVEYSDFPESATQLPVVGRHDRLDVERILSLEPDLIIAWDSGNPKAAVNQLEQLGLKTYIAEPKSLASVAESIERFSILAGTQSVGLAAASNFRAKLDRLSSEYSEKAPVRTFYQIWDAPIITVGGNELINDIITLCGGQNIFAELSLISPKIDEESVLTRNPQIIIASGIADERPDWLNRWQRWSTLDAIAGGHVYSIPPNFVQRHTPRALIGAEQMCGYIDSVRSDN